MLVVLLMGAIFSTTGKSQTAQNKQIPAAGMPTILDLGAKACIPCKMMAPILEKLELEYRGRAAVIFVDVWKDATEAKRFGIRTIPTQIFFDIKGEEVWRHEGFLEEDKIVKILDSLIKKSGEKKQIQIEQKVVEPTPQKLEECNDLFQFNALTAFYIVGVFLLFIAGWVIINTRRKSRKTQS